MTREKFDKLYLNKVVHCDTEEKANHFLALADSVGYKWSSGTSLREENCWELYKEETCYSVEEGGFMFSPTSYFIRGIYQVIEYEPLSKFKVGDKVRVNNTLYRTINEKVGVIVSVGLVRVHLVKVDDELRILAENDLEKVEEPTYKEETTESIIDEIKTKWSEINILLNRLEKKEKVE